FRFSLARSTDSGTFHAPGLRRVTLRYCMWDLIALPKMNPTFSGENSSHSAKAAADWRESGSVRLPRVEDRSYRNVRRSSPHCAQGQADDFHRGDRTDFS